MHDESSLKGIAVRGRLILRLGRPVESRHRQRRTGKAVVRLLSFAVPCGSVASRCGQESEGLCRGRTDLRLTGHDCRR
jgi:hypothetical protein